MVFKKNAETKQINKGPQAEFVIDDGLIERIQKLSERAGTPAHDLLQKWILQEEQQAGIIQRCGNLLLNELMERINLGQKPSGPRPFLYQISTPELSNASDTQDVDSRVPDSRVEDFSAVDSKATAAAEPADPDYRIKLIRRIQKLKKEGIGAKKIAELFNSEGIRTVSGTGKWYASSINWFVTRA